MENAFWNVLLLLLLLLLPLVLFPFLFECTSERFCGPLFFLYSLSALSLHSLSLSLRKERQFAVTKEVKEMPSTLYPKPENETLKTGRKKKEKNNASKTS